MRFHENEEAVSPVIGVILMVAITVILAAVIAVFVFGMTDNVQTTHTVAATAKVSTNDIIVTYQGGNDAASVDKVVVTAYDSAGAPQNGLTVTGTAIVSGTNSSTDSAGSTYWLNPTPGYTMTIASAAAGTDDRVVVTAEFDDGSTQVILDRTL